MKKIFAVLLLGALAWIGVGVGNASASTTDGWGQWLMRSGTICVQSGGSSYIARATANWNNNSDAVMVAKSTCTGYSRAMTVKFSSYNKADGNCAKTGATQWSWENVRGRMSWVPLDITVWINYYSGYLKACRGNSFALDHVLNHELGHVLGLDHNCWASVMANCSTYSWDYRYPTRSDYTRVGYRY